VCKRWLQWRQGRADWLARWKWSASRAPRVPRALAMPQAGGDSTLRQRSAFYFVEKHSH